MDHIGALLGNTSLANSPVLEATTRETEREKARDSEDQPLVALFTKEE